ncbi:MAG: ABC transporter permease subunit [Candidatus Methanoperedens sp.]|nr:ABC transporter permease subunit [Candidatus Methanoperedens sp.]
MNLNGTLIVCKDLLRNELWNTRALITIILFTIISLLSIYSASIIPAIFQKNDISVNIGYIASFLMLLLFGPIFVIAISYDIISKEIESGTIRFIIPKINRSSFVVGKFLGLNILFSLIIGIVYFIIYLYGTIYMQTYTPLYAVSSWFVLTLYFGFFVGLCLNISLLADSSSTALTISLTLLIILLLFSTGFKYESLKYLSPTWYGFIGFEAVFSPKASNIQIVKSIAGLLSLITTSFGTLIFIMNRRDL